jgi:hypothetical protein
MISKGWCVYQEPISNKLKILHWKVCLPAQWRYNGTFLGCVVYYLQKSLVSYKFSK